MAVLTRTFDPLEGPILTVTVCPQGRDNGVEVPLLMDSGADASSISRDVISALSLPPIGKRQTFASGGNQGETHTFLVDIIVPFDEAPFRFVDVVVSEFRYQKPSIRGLLGRDILCKGNFLMGADHWLKFELAED